MGVRDGIIAFDVEGDPVPWQRHKGSGSRSWTAPKVKAFKDLVTVMARQAMKGRPPLEGPCQLWVMFYMPITKAVQKTMASEIWGEERAYAHFEKPDSDNLVKGIKDAMNGVVYVDDCQVCQEHVEKWYSHHPVTCVTVSALTGAARWTDQQR